MLIATPPSPLVKQQCGVGLIEVMVAVLVLGIGMLGLLNLQNSTLQLNQQAYAYSQATNLAWDLMERMTANEDVADSYLTDFGTSVSSATDCSTQACTAEQLAAWDLNLWLDDLKKSLPQADAQISRSGATREYLISIRVDIERDGDGDLEQVDVGFRL
ncbi:type IV pilus modification protein PilV [Agaribacterium haliotis]|uniref:type IV pilus modification protein PilV n=1 Tax=Agaribacterium haliotis TaxID=2013869 RepID=UPI000BB58F48|nr:type IV pilus modification protein PilV [Agaribacterium haliotis]